MSKALALGFFLTEDYDQATAEISAVALTDLEKKVYQAIFSDLMKNTDSLITEELIEKSDQLSINGLLYLSKFFLRKKNIEQAQFYIDKVLERDTQNITAYLYQIELFDLVGDGDQIISTIQKIYPKYKNDVRVLCCVGTYAAKFAKQKQANFVFKLALKKDILFPLFCQGFYQYLQTENKEKKAISYLLQAEKIRPNQETVVYNLAMMLPLIGETAKAEVYYAKLNQIYDGNLSDKLKSGWADALFGAQKYVEAFDMAKSISETYYFKTGVDNFLQKTLYLMTTKNLDQAKIRAKQWREEKKDDIVIRHACTAIIQDEQEEELSPEYAQFVFDAFAPEFEKKLLGSLDYRGMDLLDNALSYYQIEKYQYFQILDLGCGTGLMGFSILEHAALRYRLIGVDVSGLMLDEARKKMLYTQLIQMDIKTFLQQSNYQYDLITMMDVSSYFVDLFDILKLCYLNLLVDGIMIFSILKNNQERPGLQFNGQYVHDVKKVEQCLEKIGFKLVNKFEAVLRKELNRDETSVVFTVKK
ncbi:MAG: methyltransferase domain-containing protein [Alphaproteobacteria bacterium]|nr:methyltransferase domain-containing protein [Alphaproteobacteria bacterium]